MDHKLRELLERAQAWPKEAQEHLVNAGLEIEKGYLQAKPMPAEERCVARRQWAWQRIETLRARIHRHQPDDNPNIEEEIGKAVKEVRR